MYQEQNRYEEEKLLSLLATGSEHAFQVIYNRHRNRIYRVAIRYLKSPALAQEVVQEVFLKLWIKRSDFQKELPVEGWLFTVAKNNILNRLKKIAIEWKALNHIKNNQQFEDDSTQQGLTEADYTKLIKEALGSLPEKQFQVYQLAREKNLSYREIAEQLNISPLTVKTHMSRALSHIRLFVNTHWNLLILFFIY